MNAGVNTGRLSAGLALAWLAGVAVHLRQPVLPSNPVHGAWLALSIALAGLGLWKPKLRTACLLAAIALAGFAISGLHAGAESARRLDARLEGRDIDVTGIVSELPQMTADGWRFRFDVESANEGGSPVRVPETLSLGWYAGYADEPELAGARESLRAGQRWRFTVRLKRPHGTLNPHGFDLELWLFERGVGATGYVRATRDVRARKLSDAAGAPVERWRQKVRDALSAKVGDARAAGVLAALTVGEQAAIDHDNWDLFRQTGVAHLMSISGLHVTMFAWLAAVAVGALWRRSGRLMLALPAPSAARWGGVAAAAAYAVFSGWGVPSQRTVVMLATVTLLQQVGVRWPWPLVLLSAAVAVTAVDPWALMQAGFWLSFVAVGVLMASSPASSQAAGEDAPRGWRRWWGHARGGLRTQVIATVGLTPLSLVFFQQVSVVGFAANLLAIPLVTLVITPLALLGVFFSPLWAAAAWCVQALGAYLAALLSLPGAVWTAAAAPWWAQAAGLLGGALLVMPLPWRVRLMAVPLLLPLAMPPVERPATGEFELLAADIGQGTAVILRTQGQTLLYDTGPQYGRDSDAGQRVLLPLLRALGEPRLHRLVLSHRDADHVGGAAAVLRSMPVDEMDSSLEDAHPLRALAAGRGVALQRCGDGQSWQADGVRFTMLRPDAGDYDRALKPNAMSCVLRVEGASRSVLLTGDMEAAQERAMVEHYGAALKSDAMTVPHHGSRTSSTSALLDAAQPRMAIVQAGYRNRFGHPAPDVVQRYADRGIDVLRSDRCGAWWWHADGSSACERERVRRYWHWSDDAPPQPGAQATSSPPPSRRP